LQRRARSLEQQGLYKQALSDIQAVNKCAAQGRGPVSGAAARACVGSGSEEGLNWRRRGGD
jgi:hypothetical protein